MSQFPVVLSNLDYSSEVTEINKTIIHIHRLCVDSLDIFNGTSPDKLQNNYLMKMFRTLTVGLTTEHISCNKMPQVKFYAKL